MRAARVGHLLLILGLLVGAAAGVGLLVGFEPARLPPALLNIAAYKLTFVAALGLFAAGATFLRYARREQTRAPATLPPKREGISLEEGHSRDPSLTAIRDPEAARTTRATDERDR
jgi:hypothetical protein